MKVTSIGQLQYTRVISSLEYILITNEVQLALEAQESNIHRIMIDLEIIGKEQRQGHLDTVISRHNIKDVSKLCKIIDKSKIMVRVNPIHNQSSEEINAVIDAGADIIMLPMFTSCSEVEQFVKHVDNRAKVNLLLETPQALARVDEIIKYAEIDEIHVGLNDLHLGLGLKFMFELLSGGLVEYLANKIRPTKTKFGFGGIAQLGLGKLDSSLILSEHHRLGSEMVILSREFTSKREDIRFGSEIEKINAYLIHLKSLSKEQLLSNKDLLVKKVNEIIVLHS